MTSNALISIAAGLAFLITSICAFITLRTKNLASLRDKSDGRSIGGPALGAGIAVGLCIANINPFIAAGTAFIFTIGFLDDLFNLSPLKKLLGQGIAAGIATIGLGGIAALSICGVHVSVGSWGPIFAFFWILALTNGMNLIDGLDGLAVGVSIPPTLGLLLIAMLLGDRSDSIIGAAIFGGLAGFYPWNRFHARLLLGDTGAELIGYLLAITSLRVITFDGDVFPILPISFFFALPIVDTIFAVLRRTYHHRAVFQGDRGHIHHRVKRRIGEKRATVALSLLSLLSTGIGIILWLRGF